MFWFSALLLSDLAMTYARALTGQHQHAHGQHPWQCIQQHWLPVRAPTSHPVYYDPLPLISGLLMCRGMEISSITTCTWSSLAHSTPPSMCSRSCAASKKGKKIRKKYRYPRVSRLVLKINILRLTWLVYTFAKSKHIRGRNQSPKRFCAPSPQHPTHDTRAHSCFVHPNHLSRIRRRPRKSPVVASTRSLLLPHAHTWHTLTLDTCTLDTLTLHTRTHTQD